VGTDRQLSPDPTLQPEEAVESAARGGGLAVALNRDGDIWGRELGPGDIAPGQAYQVGPLAGRQGGGRCRRAAGAAAGSGPSRR
jgi:hypothetical protein